jgi:hypothetical protein
MSNCRHLLAPLVLCLAAAATARAETVTFAFAPPLGQSFEVREVGTVAIKWGGNREEVTIGQRDHWTFSRSGNGLRLTDTTQELAMAKDGKPFQHPAVATAAQSGVVYHLGLDGRFERLVGSQRNAERMVAALEGEAKERAKQRLQEGRVGESEQFLWYERFEIFSGQTLELDRDYWFRCAWPSDDGWVPYQVLFRLGPWESTPAGRRLRVQLAYTQDALAAIPTAVELTPRVRTRFDPAKPGRTLKGYQYRGNATRLVDPATGLIWREQSFRRESHEERPIDELGITIALEVRTDFTLTPLAP